MVFPTLHSSSLSNSFLFKKLKLHTTYLKKKLVLKLKILGGVATGHVGS